MSSARRRRGQQRSRHKKGLQGSDGSQRGRARDASPGSRTLSLRRVFLVPLALTLGSAASLALLSFVPRVSGNPILARSFWGATILLLVWQVALFLRVKVASEGRIAQHRYCARSITCRHSFK